jgi:hypothetical protein
MTPHTIAGIGSAIFLSFGALGTWSVFTMLQQSRRSRSWPTVTGKIIHSELTQDISQERDSDDGRIRETTMYGVKVAYSYSVGGQAFQSGRIYWSDGIKTNVEGPARKILAAYPLGKSVVVYYQPDKPDLALLEPFTTKGVKMIGVFAAAFFAFGLVFLGLAFRAPV